MRGVPAIATLLSLAAVGCGTLDSTSRQVPPPIASPEALETRRVWAGVEPDFYVSAPSPDGRHITEVDWETGDLSVIELETAAEHRITDKGTWEELDAFAEYSVFSPDGDRLAYSWLPPLIREDGTHIHAAEVRTIRFDGSDVQTIMSHNPDIS